MQRYHCTDVPQRSAVPGVRLLAAALVFALPVAASAGGGRFTKLDAAGHALAETAVHWACVRDTATHRVWEVKAVKGLRGKDWTYTWYDGTTGTAGNTRSCHHTLRGRRCNTRNYAAAVNLARLCGYSDWRLPTRRELFSIFGHGKPTGPALNMTYLPKMDTTYFPNTVNGFYWSSDTAPYGPAGAWSVFFIGDAYPGNTSNDFYVRLVRGGG